MDLFAKPAGFAMTRIQALTLGSCCRCAIDPDLSTYSEIDAREWSISALCRECRAGIDRTAEISEGRWDG